MTLSLIVTTNGSAATATLSQSIHDLKAGDALAPVRVIVADHTHTAPLRRDLAASQADAPGISAIDVVTIVDLAERIVMPEAPRIDDDSIPLPPASELVTAALVQKALHDEPGVFAPIRDHPTTAMAIAHTGRELRTLSKEHLELFVSRSARARDFGTIYSVALTEMLEKWIDRTAVVEDATQVLVDGNGRQEAIPVILYLPAPMLAHERAFITALAATTHVVTIVALTGNEIADRETNLLLEQLGLDARTAEVTDVATDRRLHVVTTSDAEDEVRVVVRAVVDRLRDGVPARRIAVLHTTDDPYARLLADQLDAAGITYHGSTGRSLGEMTAGRFLNKLLMLNPKDLSPAGFIDLVTDAPISVAEGSRTVRAWRRLIRRHHLRGAADAWSSAIDTRIDQLDVNDTQHQQRADVARSLAATVNDVCRVVAAVRDAESWANAAYEVLAVYDQLIDRRGLSAIERSCLGSIQEFIGSIETLDLAFLPFDFELFSEIIAMHLAREQVRTGTAGTGVRLLGLEQAHGLDADVVIVCGCIEGNLPVRPGVDALLPDEDRQALRAAGAEIRIARDLVPRQYRAFLAAQTAGSAELMLTLPRGDLRKTAHHVPSRWLLEIVSDELGGRLLQPSDFLDLGDSELVRHVASFGSGLSSLAQPATEQEYSVRLTAHTGAPGSTDDRVRRSAQLVAARRSHAFTRFDGNIDAEDADVGGAPLVSPTDRTTSATRLETYVACPHRYFLKYVLDVREPDELIDIDRISALDKGSLVHEVLDRFIGDSLPMDWQYVWSAADHERLREVFDETCARYESEGLTGHPLSWQVERATLQEAIDAFLDHEQQFRHDRALSPHATELAFGREDADVDAVEITLRDGSHLSVQGAADRIDVGADGQLVISDYKTGAASKYKDITEDAPLGGGHRLQLPIYASAARAAAQSGLIEGADVTVPAAAGYWFVLDAPEPTKRVEVSLDRETDVELTETLSSIVDLARAGVYPQRPPTESRSGGSDCIYCAPDGVVSPEIARNWDAMREQPELLPLRNLLGESEDDES